MSNAFEKRLSRVEALVAKKLEPPKICTCRTDTSFHSAKCLKAVLEGASRECPTHGFRDFGFFIYCSEWCILHISDNQFCPCPEDPVRTFKINGPFTWEARAEAEKAASLLPRRPDYDFQKERDELEHVIAEYEESREQFVRYTGRQLPSRHEILELHRRAWKKKKW